VGLRSFRSFAQRLPVLAHKLRAVHSHTRVLAH
jgi:hypothetical protein